MYPAISLSKIATFPRLCRRRITCARYITERKVDPFYADSLNLQREILNPGGVEIYVSASDLLKNVAIVELEHNLW